MSDTNQYSVCGYLDKIINNNHNKTIFDVVVQEIDKTKYCPVGMTFRENQPLYFDFEATIDDLMCILPLFLKLHYKQHKNEEECHQLTNLINDIKEKVNEHMLPYGHIIDNKKTIEKLFTPLINIAKESIVM